MQPLRLKCNPWGSNPSLEPQILSWMFKFKPRSTKLTEHRSLAPLGPLPLSPLHINTHSHRGNGYRWPPNAYATIFIRSDVTLGKCHGSTATWWARLSTNLRWPKLQIHHYIWIKWFKDIHNYPEHNHKPFFVTLPTPRGSKNLITGLFLACLHFVSSRK